MGEVEWVDTELSERDNVCECCETQWRSSVKVIDGQKILEKPCPKCG